MNRLGVIQDCDGQTDRQTVTLVNHT